MIVLGAGLWACVPTGNRSEPVAVPSSPLPAADASVTPKPRDAAAPVDRATPPPPLPDVGPSVDATGASLDLAASRCIKPSRDTAFVSSGSSLVWVDPSKIAPAQLAAAMTRWLFRSDPAADVIARLADCPSVSLLQLRALAEELVDDPRADAGMQLFFSKWLQLAHVDTLTPDPAVFPAFSLLALPALRTAMVNEVTHFGSHVARLGGPSFATLLTASFSFVDGALAPIYGLPGVPGDAPALLRPLPPDGQRSGILTMPALLSIGMTLQRHSPPARGRFVLERLLCGGVPDPPPSLPPDVPAPLPGQSLRQTFERLFQPVCRPCHALVDSGWALEMFDAVGQRRTMDNGAAIDGAAILTFPDGTSQPVANPRQLAQALLDSPAAANCFVDHLFANALGFDEPVVDRLTSATTPALRRDFQQNSGNIRQLFLDIVSTADFHHQRR